MAIKILERNYNERFTDDTVDWLLGNVTDWQKLTLKCEVAIEYLAKSGSPVEIDYVNNAFILSSGEKWGDYGFDNGMVIVNRYKRSVDTDQDGEFDEISSIQRSYTINNIFGSTMEVQETIQFEDFETVPINYGTKKISDVIFYVSAVPEGCKITYGHLSNNDNDSDNLNSFIDDSETQFGFPGLNNLTLGNWGVMEPIGLQSGMSIRSAKVREVPNATVGMLTSWLIPSASVQTLAIIDTIISNVEWDSIRSVKSNIQTPVATYQSVLNDNLVAQSDPGGGVINGNQNQAFLFDADGNYNQEFLFNVNFRITAVSNSANFDNPNSFKVSVLRYTNGATMDFVERITLQEWPNVPNLINQNLSVNGVYTFAINDSDSLVLVMEFNHDSPQDNNIKTVQYIMNQGFIQASGKNQVLSGDYKKIYEFELQYMISSLFEEFTDLQNVETPSYLVGDGSLTDNFRVEFFPEWNNPNVRIMNDMEKTRRLGNTGWFNENFNELDNDFVIESVEYFDQNGNPVEAIDYSAETKVKAVIGGVNVTGSNVECGFGFAWIPTDESDYKEKTSPFYQNCFIQSGSLDDGFVLNQLYSGDYIGAGIGGASMNAKQIRFSTLGGKIVFEATFVPNASFFNTFDAKDESDRNYIIWISVADGNLVWNFSNRVSLLLDFNTLVESVPDAGSYEQIENAFIEHPLDETAVGDVILQGIVQDDILCRMPFRIPTDGSKIIQKLTFGVEAYNIGLNKTFELEKYEVDLTQYPITSDGVQQIAFNSERGFKLQSGNNKNWVKINRDNDLDTVDFAGYIAYYATKIRWEDWIQNTNAPSDFYDSNELNDGLNNDWFHYRDTDGWETYFFVKTLSEEDGNFVQYHNRFKMTFNDYDSNTNVSVTHQYFRDSDNTLLNIGVDPETGRPLGVILGNEPTRIEIEFEILDSGVWSLPDTYGVLTIEIDKGAGRFEQRQLSSVWGSETDNPLIPVAGETKLKLEVDGTNKFLKMSCLVDPDLLDNGERYRVTGRVGCIDDFGGGSFDSGLYEFRYEEVYE